MHRKFVISDLHLGHTNMALCRGFTSVEEHDDYIISKWNSVVNKNDTVYILGDITMEKLRDYYKLALLKGTKKVILGNHDFPQHVPELLKYVNSVCSSYKEKGCILTHIPIHPFEMNRYRKNIHGHVHENTIDDNRYINVSCEVIDYTPQLLSNYTMKTLLWLDDVRDPLRNDWLNFSPIGKDVNTIWVKNYKEFVDYITINDLPDAICFDHDLGEELSGMDCAKFLVDFCIKDNKKLPKYNIQSANPVGKENIDLYLKNFEKYTNDNH